MHNQPPKSLPDFIPDESGQAGLRQAESRQAGCTTYQGDFENFAQVGVNGALIVVAQFIGRPINSDPGWGRCPVALNPDLSGRR